MIVDCAVYRDGHRRQAGSLDLSEAFEQREAGDFVWVGTVNPTADELDRIRHVFEIGRAHV